MMFLKASVHKFIKSGAGELDTNFPQSEYRCLILDRFEKTIGKFFPDFDHDTCREMAQDLLNLRLVSKVTVSSIQQRLDQGMHPDRIFEVSSSEESDPKQIAVSPEQEKLDKALSETLKMKNDIYVLSLGGKTAFLQWLDNRDKMVADRIGKEIVHLANGYTGKCKPVSHAASNIMEIRIFLKSGIRIYFAMPEPNKVILLGGGNKASQIKDIQKFGELWKNCCNIGDLVPYKFPVS